MPPPPPPPAKSAATCRPSQQRLRAATKKSSRSSHQAEESSDCGGGELPAAASRRQRGTLAEAWVAAALERQGWQILVRNFRRHGFELDLVARKGQTVSIIEVKALAQMPRYGRDVEGLLGRRKQQALRRGGACAAAVLKLPELVQLRFDLALVIGLSGQGQPPRAVRYHVNVLA